MIITKQNTNKDVFIQMINKTTCTSILLDLFITTSVSAFKG